MEKMFLELVNLFQEELSVKSKRQKKEKEFLKEYKEKLKTMRAREDSYVEKFVNMLFQHTKEEVSMTSSYREFVSCAEILKDRSLEDDNFSKKIDK
jgi:hypothetical protein